MANDGVVIPAAEVGHLFEPFRRRGSERTAPSDGHHGLGLSIVSAIATAHHATLVAEARPEGGLVVKVRFPAHGAGREPDAAGRFPGAARFCGIIASMRGVIRGSVFFFAVLWALGSASAALAAHTYTVSSTADAPSGSCAGTVCTNLRGAVGTANADPGSTIELGAGTYELSSGELLITAPTTLVGAGPAATTIEQTDGTHRVLRIVSSAVTIEGITITGGVAKGAEGGPGAEGGIGEGGGILAGGGLTLVDDAIVHNSAIGGKGGDSPTAGGGAGGFALGGGVKNQGPLTILDTTIAHNLAEGGGGGTATGSGNGGLSHNVDGGAIFQFGVLSISGSTISGNEAQVGLPGVSTGGGANGAAGSALGTINSQAGSASIVNSTIAGNLAFTPGGALAVAGFTAGSLSLTLTLAADTFAENQALGGLTDDVTSAEIESGTLDTADTLFVLGSGGAVNCRLVGTTVNAGRHNLEDDAGASCGLTAGDLIGFDPMLDPLASNGGPTQTMALRPGSPALGAGGTCLDITKMGSPPLTVDQRGLPRAAPCDIGAWEAQLPAVVTPPAISGGAAVDATLTCSRGTWNGDGPLGFKLRWLRDGAPIPGAEADTYVLTAADAGRTLACEVTASNRYGEKAAQSAGLRVALEAPLISGAAESHRLWREGGSQASFSRAPSSRHARKVIPVGTVFSLQLDEPATIAYRFIRATPGRKVGSRCLKPTKANLKRAHCTRPVLAATLSHPGHAGLNELAFAGRLPGGGKLPPGTYTLPITATNADGATSNTATLRFRIAPATPGR